MVPKLDMTMKKFYIMWAVLVLVGPIQANPGNNQSRLDKLVFTSKKIEPKKKKKQPRGKHTLAQLSYHEDEIMMFVHWGPAAWQGIEYNDYSTPLHKINPTKLDTDQWCEVPKSFGAKPCYALKASSRAKMTIQS